MHIGCTIGLAALCLQASFRAALGLSDLTIFTGQLSSARVAHGMSRSSSVIFRFRSPPDSLGLDLGVASQQARQLAAQVHAGDTLTIWYDAGGLLLHQQPTRLAYQVAVAGQGMLYSLAEMHRRYWWHAALYGLVMLLFAASIPAKTGRR